MTILANIHRLFSRDTSIEKSESDERRNSRETMPTTDNVVDFGVQIEGEQSFERPTGRSGRIRTRMLPEGEEDNSYSPPVGTDQLRGGRVRRPVGWLVVIEGPGTGDWFALESGLTHLGRGADQDVCLDFGDQSISRQSHAFITYDIARHRFQICHGESRNRTRLNGEVVEHKAALSHGDRISIGKTTLRIAIFCDDQFSWAPILDKGGPQ
ncbi:MAG: FHA domain-containing protein [Boseongicola sp.]|nr:FHA domain-containing protein [Boseongicola sp.]